MSNFRYMTYDDLPDVADLCVRFMSESHLDSRQKTKEEILSDLLSMKEQITGVLMLEPASARSNGEDIVGFIGGIIIEQPFLKGKIAVELGCFVAPEYRGTRKSLQLLILFERWAKEEGADYVNMATLGSSPEVATKALLKMGYELQETMYQKKL